MIRLLPYVLMILALGWALREVFRDLDPRRLQAAGWGLLSGALIVGGVWMIAEGV